MARKKRESSESGYAHLIMRGNNKQVLFEEDEDYRFYLSKLGKYSRELQITINAYCLMENHVHLLVNDQQGHVPEMMQRIGISYTKYYNDKYERGGHLFQGRYLCEPVRDEVYLLTVFRYILNNPRKAGICTADQYRWSSYKAYFKENTSIDTGFVKDRFPTEDEYRYYIGTDSDDACMEYDKPVKDDNWALETIRSCLNVDSGSALQAMEKKDRDKALKRLKDEGLTVRQIERLTGISRSTIQRVGQTDLTPVSQRQEWDSET